MQVSETDGVETVRYVQLWARDVQAEVRINDVPICTAEPGKFVSQAMPIRQLMLPGQNRLTVDLGDLSAPPRRGGWSGMAECTVRIADFEDGQTMDEINGIERVRLDAVFGPETPNPMRQQATFTARTGGDWLWTQGPQIDPVANKPQLDAFMAQVHAAWAAQTMEPLIALYEPMIRDFVRAYPVLDIEGMIRETRFKMAYFEPEFWSVAPFDPARAVYRPAGDGRLIQPMDVDGQPLIRTADYPLEPDEDTPRRCSFDNLIGVQNGQLRVMF